MLEIKDKWRSTDGGLKTWLICHVRHWPSPKGTVGGNKRHTKQMKWRQWSLPTQEAWLLSTLGKAERDSSTALFFLNFSNFVSPLYTYYSNHECHCLPPLGTGKTSILQVLLGEVCGRPRLLSQNIQKLRFRKSKLRIKLVSFARFWICVSQPKVSLQKHRNCEQRTCEKQPFASSSPEQHARHSQGSGGASALGD